MVAAIIIATAIVAAAALIAWRGIRIKFDKTFTIRDERQAQTLTPEQAQRIEQELNNPTQPESNSKPKNPELNQPQGPMDDVIKNIQELFGPDPIKEEDK